jgi:hypothetical protein
MTLPAMSNHRSVAISLVRRRSWARLLARPAWRLLARAEGLEAARSRSTGSAADPLSAIVDVSDTERRPEDDDVVAGMAAPA